MPNKSQSEQSADEKKQRDERETLDKIVGERIIHALGKPTDLRDVQVRKLWDAHYRVNVIVGANASSVKVAKSYFVVIDSKGNVVTATPKITKQY